MLKKLAIMLTIVFVSAICSGYVLHNYTAEQVQMRIEENLK